MVWSRASLGLMCCLALACGPEGVAAPETDGESEDSSGSGTTGDATNPTATNPTNSGSATTTATTDDTVNPEDSSGDSPATTDPTTGECPIGTEGCLCDIGAECDEGLVCNGEGICVSEDACRPIDTDPHGDEDSAYELDMLGCGDTMDLGVVATLEGPERDWYAYAGGEAFMCPEQPEAAVVANVDLSVCVYIECVEGTAVNVQCAGDGTDSDSPDGRPGCCGDNAVQIQDYDCMGMFAGLDVNVWIAVSSDEEICEDYELSYEF